MSKHEVAQENLMRFIKNTEEYCENLIQLSDFFKDADIVKNIRSLNVKNDINRVSTNIVRATIIYFLHKNGFLKEHESIYDNTSAYKNVSINEDMISLAQEYEHIKILFNEKVSFLDMLNNIKERFELQK